MTHAMFLAVKKLTGKAIIEVAARHNHREILAEIGATPSGHIDPERVGLNRVLRGQKTAADVAREAQKLLDEAGLGRIRKDAVRALEIVFSLPPDSLIDGDQFFNDAVNWTEEHFKAPVISAIVHNDEAAPHCHVLILPLIGGHLVGSDLMGGPSKLRNLHAEFHAQVGQRYGLVCQSAQRRPDAPTRKRAIEDAYDVLQVNSGLSDAALRVLLAPHLRDPAPLLLMLGLPMPAPARSEGSFAKIMTKPCKPEKPIGFAKKKPIGFDDFPAQENERTLSCVGFAESVPSPSPDTEPQTGPCRGIESLTMVIDSSPPAEKATGAAGLTEGCTEVSRTAADGDYTRQYDDDEKSEYWSYSLGEFIKPLVVASGKPSIVASVRVALEAIHEKKATSAVHRIAAQCEVLSSRENE